MAHAPQAGRPGPGEWLAARTLRGRLVVGLLVLLALACATVGVVTYTHLRSVLVSQLNTELKGANFRYVDCVTPDRRRGRDASDGDNRRARRPGATVIRRPSARSSRRRRVQRGDQHDGKVS